MNRAGGLALLSILTLILSAPVAVAHASDSARALDQLDLRIWSTDQGLPHNSVLSLGQTSDGMLWVGTWAGLARFDGVEFRVYDRDNTPAIGDNGILAIAPASSGGLWMGTHRGGVLKVVNGHIEGVVAAGSSIRGHVLVLHEVDADLWIGTEGAGLYRLRANQVDPVVDSHLGAAATVMSLAVDQQGFILAGTRDGAVRVDPRTLQTDAIELPAQASGSAVSGLFELSSGAAWLASSLGVYRRDAASEAWRQIDPGASASLMLDQSGRAWVGTPSQGVLRIGAQSVERLRVVQGLPDSRVRAVLEDRDGGVWLGTNGGLVGLQSLPFRAVGSLQGLSNDYVRALLETSDGNVWVATARGLNRVKDGQVERIGGGTALADQSLLSLTDTGDGSLWVGTYADGLIRVHDGVVSQVPNLVLPNAQVRAVVGAADGSLWVGTQGGLVHYDPSQQRMLALPAHTPTASVMALHRDRKDRLWVGTSEGLSRIDGDRVAEFDVQQGFPGEAVFAFQETADGEVWIGSDAGLVRYADDRFATVGPSHGLPFYSVLSLSRDAGGDFWLGSGTGIFRVRETELRAVLAGTQPMVNGRLFERDDGMPSSQCNGGSMPASIRLRNGELWFATARGVAVVNPGTIDDRPPAPPAVVINHIVIDDRESPVEQRVDLPSGRHTIAAQFAAIALSRQGQVDNAYRVLGLDSRWEYIGAERAVRLTNLPPGEYVLEMAARFGDGALSSQPARFEFSVAPVLWQRAWFIPVVLGAGFLVGMLLFRWRTEQLRRRQLELQRLVGEQTQALAREMGVIAQRDREKTELLRQLEIKSTELERLAREDGLTGVFNRRHFDERLREWFAQDTGAAPSQALLLFDLDRFKSINDERSHQIGDLVLQRFAAMLRAQFADGVVARYGGEEFVVALSGVNLDGARARADALRAQVAASPWHELARGLEVTVSAGVAVRDAQDTPEKLVAAADARLYEAKHRGRNRVE